MNIVNLDIGGIKFKTTKQTLQRYESIINGLVENNSDNSEIFIDRNGKCFEYILEFFRNGDNVILSEDKLINKMIYLECQYYCLVELQHKIKEKYMPNQITTLTLHVLELTKIESYINDEWFSNDKTNEELVSEHENFKQNDNDKYNLMIKSNKLKPSWNDWIFNKKNEYTKCFIIKNKEIIINLCFPTEKNDKGYFERKFSFYVNLQKSNF
jgi:hypothetical protein